jgi:hypothetical protein
VEGDEHFAMRAAYRTFVTLTAAAAAAAAARDVQLVIERGEESRERRGTPRDRRPPP